MILTSLLQSSRWSATLHTLRELPRGAGIEPRTFLESVSWSWWKQRAFERGGCERDIFESELCKSDNSKPRRVLCPSVIFFVPFQKFCSFFNFCFCTEIVCFVMLVGILKTRRYKLTSYHWKCLAVPLNIRKRRNISISRTSSHVIKETPPWEVPQGADSILTRQGRREVWWGRPPCFRGRWSWKNWKMRIWK